LLGGKLGAELRDCLGVAAQFFDECVGCGQVGTE